MEKPREKMSHKKKKNYIIEKCAALDDLLALPGQYYLHGIPPPKSSEQVARNFRLVQFSYYEKPMKLVWKLVLLFVQNFG